MSAHHRTRAVERARPTVSVGWTRSAAGATRRDSNRAPERLRRPRRRGSRCRSGRNGRQGDIFTEENPLSVVIAGIDTDCLERERAVGARPVDGRRPQRIRVHRRAVVRERRQLLDPAYCCGAGRGGDRVEVGADVIAIGGDGGGGAILDDGRRRSVESGPRLAPQTSGRRRYRLTTPKTSASARRPETRDRPRIRD